MALVDTVGKDGHTIQMWKYEDMYFDTLMPVSPKDHLEAIQNWNARSDDVFVCSYPKAGTHWTWEIASMLQSGKAEPMSNVMKLFEHRKLSVFDDMDSPRVIGSHLCFRNLPRQFREMRGKIIYVLRNPKDIAVSFYRFMQNMEHHRYEGSWSSFLELFEEGRIQYGKWFDHVKDWERVRSDNPDYPIFFVHYEDMKKNGSETLRKMAEFLGVSTDSKFLSDVKDNCSFKNITSAKQISDEDEVTKTMGGFNIIYRKGEVGDWKNWFTVAESERFDELYRKEMADSDLRDCFQL